jgi:DNA-binding transcriptional MerR regulator
MEEGRTKMNNIQHKYSVSKFASLLGLSRRTIYRWIQKGIVEAPKKTPSGIPYYTNEDLAKYEELKGKVE